MVSRYTLSALNEHTPVVEARGVFESIFGISDTKTVTTATETTSVSRKGSLTSTLVSSAITDLPTQTTTDLPLTRTLTPASITSTTSTSVSTSTTSDSNITSNTSVASNTASSVSTATPTPSPIPSSAATTPMYVSSDGGGVITVTSTGYASVTPSASSSATAAPSVHHKSFLENKPLSGIVFALVSVIGLVLIVGLGTYALRRSQRNRLERDALDHSPDWFGVGPGAAGSEEALTGAAKGASMEEKPAYSSDGTSSNGHAQPPNNYGPGYGAGYGGPMPSRDVYYTQPTQPQQAYPTNYGYEYAQPINQYPAYGAPMAAAYGQPQYNQGMQQMGTSLAYDRPLPSAPTAPLGRNPSAGPTGKLAHRTSLINANMATTSGSRGNSPPASPGAQDGVSADRQQKRTSSHIRELDPTVVELPPSPVLPTTFGASGPLRIMNK